MIDLKWFNLGGPTFFILGIRFKMWNLFSRRFASPDLGFQWGMGMLQVGSRHLFFVGTAGISIAFLGRTS